MAAEIREFSIKQVMDHWQVYINGEFFCSADTYKEAIDEVRSVYGN